MALPCFLPSRARHRFILFTEEKGEEEHPAQQRVMTFGKLQCYVDVDIYSRLKSNLEGITES